MDPIFRTEREKQNFLSYETYKNDSSIFCFHSQIELYFIEKGEMDITVNHNRKLLKEGEMSVALSFDAHTYSTPEFSESSALFIPLHTCPDFIESIKSRRAAYPFICDKKVVHEIKGFAVKLSQCKNNPVKAQGYIYLILGLIMENIFFESADEALDANLSTKLLKYINDNFSENISLATASREMGYNSSYISRYFKSCFGIGFNRYLCTIRLKNVLMLMKEKKHTLTHSVMESGFNSLRTFYRAFHKEFGCTPKEYMK